MCLNIGSLLHVCLSIGNLLLLCLSSLKYLAFVLDQLESDIDFSELSLEVQGRQDYFQIVEETCIVALCLPLLSLSLSLSLSPHYPLHETLNSVPDSELYQTLNIGLSFKIKKKLTQFNPPFCVFLTFSLVVRNSLFKVNK